MNRWNLTGCLMGAIFLMAAQTPAAPSVTIYNQNFAVVRDQLALDLKKGINEISATDITTHLEPNSVILRDPEGKRGLRILEQNYRADPISESLLLSVYEGKEITFLRDTNTICGKIIRSGYVPHQSGMQRYGQMYRMQQAACFSPEDGGGQPIIEVDHQLRFNLPGLPQFPSLPDDTILKPTLHWLLETDREGALKAELSYVTGGMTWSADYNMVSPEQDDRMDIVGWVTMDNQSGKTFHDAHIKLMAGDVNKIQPADAVCDSVAFECCSGHPSGMQPPVSEKAFDDYHLYVLNRPVTLRDRETKQVEFIRAANVKSDRVYVYDGAMIERNRYRGYPLESLRQDRDYGTKCNPKVWVVREVKNAESNHLGIPLPAGRVRFYRQDTDGQLEFTGENTIEHTPKDETLRIYTGNAFDISGKRTRTDFKIDNSRSWCDETFEIKVQNHKEKEPVEVRVVEHLYRWTNWTITEKTNTFLKTDSQTVEFRLQLKPGEEQTITYTVHYSW